MENKIEDSLPEKLSEAGGSSSEELNLYSQMTRRELLTAPSTSTAQARQMFWRVPAAGIGLLAQLGCTHRSRQQFGKSVFEDHPKGACIRWLQVWLAGSHSLF